MKTLTSKKHWNSQYKNRTTGKLVDRLPYRNFIVKQVLDLAKTYFKRDERLKLLEFGCGNSYWLPLMHKNFKYKVDGIDYSDLGCALAKEMLTKNDINGHIYNMDFLKINHTLYNTYDICVSFGVVEHFDNPDAIINIFARTLKDGGIMLTVIPKLIGIQGFLQRNFNKKIYNMHNIIELKDLINIHERNKLKIIYAKEIGFAGLGINPGEKLIVQYLYKLFSYLLNRACLFFCFDKIYFRNFGSNYIVIGQKV